MTEKDRMWAELELIFLRGRHIDANIVLDHFQHAVDFDSSQHHLVYEHDKETYQYAIDLLKEQINEGKWS